MENSCKHNHNFGEKHKKDIIDCIQKNLDFYCHLCNKTRHELENIENINDRICAMKSMLKVECYLYKLQKKICSLKKSCSPHGVNDDKCSDSKSCCSDCKCEDNNKRSEAKCCEEKSSCCKDNSNCGCKNDCSDDSKSRCC